MTPMIKTISFLRLRFTVFLLLLLVASPAFAGTYYVSPSAFGSYKSTSCADTSDATRCPISEMIAYAQAGDYWKLTDGSYNPISLNCSYNFRSGESNNPITIQAENERQAFIQGTGNEQAAFFINQCSYITVSGFHMEQQDFNGASDGNIFECDLCTNITFTRNILKKHNRYHNSGVSVWYQSSYLTITENEFYQVNMTAILLANVDHAYVARNYANKRGDTTVIAGAVGTTAMIDCYPCTNTIMANNIAEGFVNNTSGGPGAGVSIQASNAGANNNQVLGGVVFNGSYGMLLTSRTTNTAANTPHDIAVKNQATINNNAVEYFWRSPYGVTCENCTAIGYATPASGAVFICDEYDPGGSENGAPPYSCSATNSLLVSGHTGNYGAYINANYSYTGTWNYVNSYNRATDVWGTGGITHTNITTTNPSLGACKVFVPDGSPMKGAGASGADIGANVLYQYDQNGVLTSTKLWDTSTGAPLFMGAIITGVNDRAGSSLYDVADRLNINQNGCTFPASYLQ